MDVILLERVENLGHLGQVVKVKPGYARNFLLPRKKALRATKDNLAYFESQKARLEAANQERRKEAEVAATKVNGLSVIITRQAAETGLLYGSVSPRDIAEAAAAKGAAVTKNQVAIESPIKTLGLFKVKVILHPEVSVTITVNVARSLDEAELQAKRGGMITGKEEEMAEDAAAAAEAEAEASEG
jgi:large subunit ribosomal protein L9